MLATTTALYGAVSVSTSTASSFIWTMLNTPLMFVIWALKLIWPFLLVLGLVGLLLSIARRMRYVVESL
jgi:hypothetical protein